MDKMVTKFKMVKEIYVAWLVDKKKKENSNVYQNGYIKKNKK